MNIFKIVLSTVGGEKEKVLYMLPPTKMIDEETGVAVFDEEEVAATQEYKEFIKKTKANVIDISYTLYKAPDNITKDYNEIKNEEQYFDILEKNEYIVEVKSLKAAKSNKKTPKALYVVIVIIILIVGSLMIYDSITPNAKKNNDASHAETTIDEFKAKEDTTIIAEQIVNEAPTSTSSSEATTTTPVIATNIITFEKNGGNGALAANKEYTIGTVVDLPLTSELSNVGYNLVGWATAPQEPYTLYDNELNRLTMAENITLYAIWSAKEYKVIYNYDINGTAATSSESAMYGTEIELMNLNGVKSSRGTFVGWNINPTAKEAIKSCTMPANDLQLYAIYKK